MSTDVDRQNKGMFGLAYETEDLIFRVLKGVSAAVFFVVGIFPVYWMFQKSFTTFARSNKNPVSWIPLGNDFTINNYFALFNPDLAKYITNTIIVTVGTITLVVVISLVAGYGLARFEMPHKNNFARLLLMGYLFSPIVLGVPLFLIWRNIGLLNTRVGLILALSAISMPFAVWLMWKYVQTIPEAMEESAWIAGASRWQGFRDIIIPQTQPAIIAAALFAFAIAWNDFTFAEILLRRDTQVFAVKINELIAEPATRRVEVLAVSMTMTLPPLLFAYFMQSYLLKGFEIRSL